MASKRFLTEKDIDYLEQRLKETFITQEKFKKFRSELFGKLDEILKEVLANREEMEILDHRSVNHEDRLTSLEKIHPAGQHASA